MVYKVIQWFSLLIGGIVLAQQPTVKKFLKGAALLVCGVALAQQATTGLPSPQMSGAGAPTGGCGIDPAYQGLSYIQTDATNGRIWLCDQSSGSWAWDHLINPIMGTAVTGQFSAQSYLLGGCSSILTVSAPGVVVGSNAATASPIYASAPSGNPGLLNIQAWVSANNTISVQGCAAGTLTSVPAWTGKVVWY